MAKAIPTPSDPLYLAIDQGTHAIHAQTYDRRGRALSNGIAAVSTTHPRSDWAQQDGEQLVTSVFIAATQALQALGPRRHTLVAAGLASQRASVICWDGLTGKVLSPVFTWQDRRAYAWIEQMLEHEEAVHSKTGKFLSSHYGASKLRWALDHLSGVRSALRRRTLRWGPVASFLAFRLCAQRPFLAESQCAADTQLWNIKTRDWDPELLSLFGLPSGFLPRSVPACHAWGTLDFDGVSIPLTAVNGDPSSTLFAHGPPERDAVYVNVDRDALVQRVLSTFAGCALRQGTSILLDEGRGSVYTADGNVNGAGSALTWASVELGIDKLMEKLPQWLTLCESVPLFLNGVSGLGSPFWQADFCSRFIGDGQPRQKAVAVLESIVFLLQANIDQMSAYVPVAQRIHVSGCLSRLDGLCQRLACISGLPVHRRDDSGASASGIAYLAAGRPARWNAHAPQVTFSVRDDPKLRDRYRRWRALMMQATGI